MDKDLGVYVSVVRLKVENVNVVVFGRDDATSRPQVYRRCDYISCVMEQVGVMSEKWCSTGRTPAGKDSRAKQVWTAYFLSI